MTKKPDSPVVGIAERAPVEWIRELSEACDALHLKSVVVDISRNDWIQQLKGIDILIWRIHLGDPTGIREARIKIPIAESMRIVCYPGSLMAELYDDKISQAFFFQQGNIMTPETFVGFQRGDAVQYASQARYPLVAKTAGGASSVGVSLIQSRKEAERIIGTIFRGPSFLGRAARIARQRLGPKSGFLSSWRRSMREQTVRYVYFQEYVKTDGDLRVVTLGSDLVSVFARRNRPGDFRASGSGKWEGFTEETLPHEPCKIALELSNKHGFTSMAFDFLQSKKGWLITEMSYTFLLNRVYTDNLFRRNGSGFRKEQSIPMGNILIEALLNNFEMDTR